MSTARSGTPGATRTCPHCRTVILESAAVCPGCRHHVRSGGAPQHAVVSAPALAVECALRRPSDGETWEYAMVLSIRDQRGEEITRQVVGVGALQPSDERTFTLSVEVFKPAAGIGKLAAS
ncbi:MAG: hypothetical protein H0W15_02060 [Gemmatimonadales bacterium]|nr:hypothetical protein [Gemmatimonadales bacterium]